MARHRIAALGEVPEGGNRAFDVEGRSILLCRSSAGVFAADNICSHAFSYLEGGRVKGVYLFCPLHGVRFDLRSGAPSGNLTKKSLSVYPVRVEGDEVFAELPDD
jgi:3-phenylpropionate/trans-cinnamate dioxygenase ferredoxin subunit